MSLKEKKSKDIDYIFGSAWVYKTAKGDWVKIIPPEIGDIKHSVRSDDHVGWLLCNGREVSRTTYLDLYNVIQANFGTPSTGEVFKLPDARGRVLGGINPSGSSSDLTTRLLGAKVGEESVTLTVAQMPAHTHTNNSVLNSLGLMTANGTGTATGADTSAGEPSVTELPKALINDSTGGGGTHGNMQPTLFIGNVFIFAKHQTESVRA
jgi:microcystin-dependent protein